MFSLISDKINVRMCQSAIQWIVFCGMFHIFVQINRNLYMNGFTIKNFQDTASFELEVIQRGDIDDIDALVRTNYDFQGRTISSTHRWSFGLGEVSWFMDKVTSMHENLKGCSRFSSFDEDELFLTIDEFGHIDVTVKDGIASYNGRVEFKFQIDQSYLPELIEQLKKFIEANR